MPLMPLIQSQSSLLSAHFPSLQCSSIGLLTYRCGAVAILELMKVHQIDNVSLLDACHSRGYPESKRLWVHDGHTVHVDKSRRLPWDTSHASPANWKMIQDSKVSAGSVLKLQWWISEGFISFYTIHIDSPYSSLFKVFPCHSGSGGLKSPWRGNVTSMNKTSCRSIQVDCMQNSRDFSGKTLAWSCVFELRWLEVLMFESWFKCL